MIVLTSAAASPVRHVPHIRQQMNGHAAWHVQRLLPGKHRIFPAMDQRNRHRKCRQNFQNGMNLAARPIHDIIHQPVQLILR